MSLFAIADLHLSFGANKSMEIFPGWENYTERIEKNWRKVVRPEDTVVIAGDVSWAMSLKELPPDFDFLQSLPGQKLIIKGNHDYWWDTMSKMSKFATNGGYDSISFIHNNAKMVSGVGVCGTRGWFNDGSEDRKILLREVGRLETSISIAEKAGIEPVVFLHYPPICAGYYCSEIMDVLKSHGVRRCYYGHLHGRATGTAIEGEHEGIIFRLISCDRTDFAPAIVENDVD